MFFPLRPTHLDAVDCEPGCVDDGKVRTHVGAGRIVVFLTVFGGVYI
jgi:hypothetical protein